MFNLYVIILGLFALAGLALTLRGWKVLQQSKKAKTWPKTEGRIVSAAMPASEFEELVPMIVFTYSIDGVEYNVSQDFRGVSLTQDLCRDYVEKYPAGKTVDVYYNPRKTSQATLEPALKKDDWMIFVAGILATIFGLLLIFINV